MALVKCKECGAQVSTKAKTCPSCGAPNKKRLTMVALIGYAILAFLMLGAIGSCIDRHEASLTPEQRQARDKVRAQRQAEAAKREAETQVKADKPQPASTKEVDRSALFLIEGSGWEKARAQWGPAGIKRINSLMPEAARKVAASPECRRVEIAGWAEDRSTPRKKIMFYVDCEGGKRFYVSEVDLRTAGPAASTIAKTAAIDDVTAIEACENSVRRQLKYPLTFDRHRTDTSVYRAPTGNVVAQFTFDAKNGLGAELPQRAKCYIDDRGMSAAEITRQ